ncbi:MAG TPA: universal stress protein [Cytophagales bacterium]|nr:universal stress protein [Cytophagales bacterium]
MKTILVPTDFSKNAGLAMDVARDIALKSKAKVIMLHVVEAADSGTFNVEGEAARGADMQDRFFTMKLIERSKKQLEKAVQDPKYSDIRVEGELRLGNAYHGIQSIITEHKVDLVVMGTAGQSKAEEVLVGSNTEKVVRRSKCPVLTVHNKPVTTNFKSIVYATSMAKDEEVFSRIIKRTQQLYDSTINLVRINTPGDFQPDHIVMDYMEKFAKNLGLKNYSINTYNDLSVEEGILRFSQTVGADLIAMATHGRTGLSHLLAGSVAESVVSKAKRLPVLTFSVRH